MKATLTVIGIISILVVLFSAQNGCSNNQDVLNDLEQKHEYLNERIDTIQVKLDQLDWLVNQLNEKTDTIGNRQIKMFSDIKSMGKDIDTLKVGQIIIYDEVTNFQTNKETSLNWAGKLIDWLE